MSKKFAVLVAVVAIGGLAAGIGLYAYLNPPTNEPAPTAQAGGPESMIGKPRPGFTLEDTRGERRSASEWDGKVLMINFWATWCPPCRREIPAFIELHDDYHAQGLEIVGIALDTKQAAIDFTDPMAVDYPILVAEQEGIALTREYGNDLGVLPYTVFVDRDGRIVEAHRSELSYEEAEKIIKPLL